MAGQEVALGDVAKRQGYNRPVQRFTGICRCARYSFICLMEYFPKCAIEATRTASAPASTMAWYRCSRVPAPPEAITGMLTASAIALVIGMSYPAWVPSASILVGRICPAPRSSAFFAQSTASIPVGIVPPATITSKPEGNFELVFVSIAIVILSLPNSFAASLTKPGFLTAAVLMDTPDAPIFSSFSMALQFVIPPPTVNGTDVFSTVLLTASRRVFLFSMVAVMSRKTSSSAPALL